MRRLVLIFVMCLLPVQWTWAAAASVCAHEVGQSHFGHHEHKHAASSAAEQPAEAQADASPLDSHPDCKVCQGVGAAFVMSTVGVGHAWFDDGPASAYGHFLPEPPVESLLRPPLNLVA